MSFELIAKLVAAYPRAFFPNQDDRQPLKIGISRELAKATHGLSRRSASTSKLRAGSSLLRSVTACDELWREASRH
jgi:sRNA-binding protein